MLVPRVYRLKQQSNVDTFIADLTKTIEPESWANEGSGATVKSLTPDFLVVLQTYPVHRQIAQRYAESLQAIDDGEQIRLIPGLEMPVTALNAPASIEMIETALKDVIGYLSEKSKVELSLEAASLRDLGLRGDTPIARQLLDLPLSAVLSLLLEELELAWVPADDGLVITSRETAQAKMIQAEYDLPERVRDKKAFIDICHRVILPRTWEGVGGPGTIRLSDAGKLEVRNSFAAHQQLLALLATLDSAKHPSAKN